MSSSDKSKLDQIPSFTTLNAGDALKVNSSGTGLEWSDDLINSDILESNAGSALVVHKDGGKIDVVDYESRIKELEIKVARLEKVIKSLTE